MNFLYAYNYNSGDFSNVFMGAQLPNAPIIKHYLIMYIITQFVLDLEDWFSDDSSSYQNWEEHLLLLFKFAIII